MQETLHFASIFYLTTRYRRIKNEPNKADDSKNAGENAKYIKILEIS